MTLRENILNLLKTLVNDNSDVLINLIGEELTAEYRSIRSTIQYKNPWFTPENIDLGVRFLAHTISEQKQLPEARKEILHIYNEDFPLEAFSIMIEKVLQGGGYAGKALKTPNELNEFLAKLIFKIEPDMQTRIKFDDFNVKSADSVLIKEGAFSEKQQLTYFQDKMELLSPKRSVLLLNGDESVEQMERAGEFVFNGFGFYPFSVKTILIPNEQLIQNILPCWEKFQPIMHHHRYANNYEYQRSVLLFNKQKHYDNGFLILQESNNLLAPTGMLFFVVVKNNNDLIKYTERNRSNIFAIISERNPNLENFQVLDLNSAFGFFS